MKLNKSPGMMLLSFWLVLWALVGVFNAWGPKESHVMQALAVITAVVILFFDKSQAASGS
ncbi:MAG TPA: hypothetical protein VMT77_05480 [Gemmatimonadales bacterium]|nr:hypothetical protein [Gemmatimonadales bacterium]